MPPVKKKSRTEPEKVSLSFSQPLSKGVTASELVKRLKQLYLELADIDQDLIDTESLNAVAKDLIQPFLLLHKEKGVKAFLACCLVDILRLYAPEAPYTQPELKDLFQFLFRQLKHLTNATEAHFSEYFYVIESLSNVKSIVIVCDLDSADDLMADLFRQSSSSPKNVQIAVADILSQLLEEVAQPSSEVVETLLAQFHPKNAKQNAASYLLAVEVARASADKLQRYVCQYFAEVITSTINGAHDSDAADDSDSTSGVVQRKKGAPAAIEELPEDFVKAHHLVKQIMRAVPTLLLNVIPQLEEELTADKPAYRKLATETLGAMAGDKAGQGDLALKYPTAWRAFLGRAKDRMPAVRIAVVDALPKIWIEHPELSHDIEGAMMSLLVDQDDKVRIAACRAFEGLDYETTSTHINKKVLEALSTRCLDSKASVRVIAFDTLGRLYNLAFSEIESRDEHAIEHYSWIPGVFCEAYHKSPVVVQNLVLAKMLEFIVPPPKKDDDEVQWVDRLLLVLRHLSPTERGYFLHMTRLISPRPSPFEYFLGACEANNGGIIDANEAKIKQGLKGAVKAIATRFSPSDQTRVVEDLTKFAKANEKQLYKVLRSLLDVQVDLKTQIKSWKDCTRRLEQVSSGIVDTFQHCLRQYAFLLVNRSSISPLLLRVRSPTGPDGPALASLASEVLGHISKHRPALYKSHAAELTKSLVDGTADVALHALARLAKADRTFSLDKKLSEKAKEFARKGTAVQAKQAATLVALDQARPGSADDLVEFLADALPDASEAELIPHLSALNRLARYAPHAFENKSEQVTTSVLEILMRGTVPGEILDDDEALWVADEDLDDLTKARILSVKILTSRCLGYADDEDTAAQVSIPVFHLLWPLLQARDENSRYSPPVASRLRLVSALCLLKLASSDKFTLEITKRFDVLARVAQDPCYEVRSAFVSKLTSIMRGGSLKSPRFNMIFFMVAHDPEADVIETATSFIKHATARSSVGKRQAEWEHPFVRLIHLLAHHPDFAGSADDEVDLGLMAKYIEMFVEHVVTKENIPFVYHVAVRIKQVADAESPDFNQRLYILSELSQYLLNRVALLRQWPIPAHPVNVPLPTDIFKPLSTAKAAEAKKKNYLSAEILGKVAPMGKINKQTRVKAEPSIPKKRKSSPKAKSANGAKRTAKSKKKEPKWNSGSEDESDPESDIDSDSDADEAQPAAKKVRGPPPPESKRASLARGVAAKSSPAPSPAKKGPSPAKKAPPPAKKAVKAQTRGVVKKLAAPRAMVKNNQGDVSDLSDGEDGDEEMADE
ncbi:hypothetical protein RQP46_007010 [Phenoliferia psychrophenolica]